MKANKGKSFINMPNLKADPDVYISILANYMKHLFIDPIRANLIG